MNFSSSVTVFQNCAFVSQITHGRLLPFPPEEAIHPSPGLDFEIWHLSVRKVLFPHYFRYSSMTENTNVIIAWNDSKQLQGWEETWQLNPWFIINNWIMWKNHKRGSVSDYPWNGKGAATCLSDRKRHQLHPVYSGLCFKKGLLQYENETKSKWYNHFHTELF